MLKSAKSDNFSSLFDGHAPSVIASWCMVTEKTARDWINGRKRPSRRAVRLFQLHAQGRILGKSWRGWIVNGDVLYDPAGNAIKRTDMEIHVIVYQIASYCRRHHTFGEQVWDTIIRLRS